MHLLSPNLAHDVSRLPPALILTAEYGECPLWTSGGIPVRSLALPGGSVCKVDCIGSLLPP